MRRTLASTFLAPAFLALAIAGCAAGDASNGASGGASAGATSIVARAGDLVVTRAVAPAPIGDSPAALYFTVVNEGTAADTLTHVESDAAAEAMLHDQVRRGGSVMMEHVGPLPISPGDSLRLAPGGLHVMLTGLRQRIAAGDTLRATLHFSRAGAVEIRAPVVTYGELEGRA
ncbi:MAG TPA: copper chaperone PCu(A)C [Gemmatimonadaceae bacterium]|nr:copper chaperone PCu(A)C [Gemmatimonadaceae bacterium]